MSTTITVQDIAAARGCIRGRVRETMTVASPALSEITGGDIHLKLEQMQITGSFKLRGATNAVLSLTDEQKAAGVVGVSTGNHGRGLAYAASQAGVRCIVAMSELVPQNKIDGIKAQGAEVRIIGRSQDDAQVEVDRLVAEEGMTMIPPFDHPDIIAGQGTLGLELLDQMPEVETVLVPLSGGGLISGVAAALKARRPGIRVIGISMERGAAMYECLQAGKPVLVPELATLADSLGGGIGLENAYTFAMTRDLVDEVVLVNEAEIAQAIRHAYWQERQVIEGSGSVGIAALMSGKIETPGKCVVLVSGQNIDMKLHHRIISGEDVDVTQATSGEG
ncbi:hydroxyectoine utilization dehydratase EutB [Roseovarius aestuarii]|uniref:L-threonine dehydratase catabolic TdcB n=1 Tax=Roseovarius aestuarii TaxID=475083 RepID=A0A1X7BY01_9RHOB|nr:hydroxyectoine utilization dehydratase EutB [Roseovarius aestuarii]SMC14452.1 L-threonine dehydratase catabolic TdcB [Roseovarius aestuarii]